MHLRDRKLKVACVVQRADGDDAIEGVRRISQVECGALLSVLRRGADKTEPLAKKSDRLLCDVDGVVGAGTLRDVLPDRPESDANLEHVAIPDPGAVDQRQQIGVVVEVLSVEAR